VSFWEYTFVKQLSKDTKKNTSKILSFFLVFEKKNLLKMSGLFKHNFNFSLFYQNFIKITFFKNLKRTWLSHHLGFLWKTVFPQNLRLTNTNLMQKTD
jgi:phosphate starvation-inducible membrane PsiE